MRTYEEVYDPAARELVSLADINRAIWPLSITAGGLRALCGITPVDALGRVKMYYVADAVQAIRTAGRVLDHAGYNLSRAEKEIA